MNSIVKMADMIQMLYDREDSKPIISVSVTTPGNTEIHVTAEYFDEHFGGFTHEVTPWPRQEKIHLGYTTPSGALVFCLKDATWEVTAA